MKKPLIAVSCNFDSIYHLMNSEGDISDITVMYHYVSDNYTRAVEEAGGVPLLLPIYKNEDDLKEALNMADGVLLSGGNDIDPILFEETDRGKSGRISPKRDAQDISIARYICRETKNPLLGICRGVQVMNVALGGSIYQDLEADGGFLSHSRVNYPMNSVSHFINIRPESRLADIFGQDKAGVNSYHHQAVKDVAPGFYASALSEDGVIEAIEPVQDGRFVLGVQWHPEKMYDSQKQHLIFTRFIEACCH